MGALLGSVASSVLVGGGEPEPGVGPEATRWRWYVRDRTQNGYVWVDEVYFRNVPDGANSALHGTTGVASASSQSGASYSANKAFNGIDPEGTGWSSASYSAGTHQWLEFTFDAPITINQIEIHSKGAYEALDFDLQYHNGTGWIIAKSYKVTTADYPSSRFKDTITYAAPAAKNYWRTRARAGGSGGLIQIGEVEMFEATGGDVATSALAIEDHHYATSAASGAFDNGAGRWQGLTNNGYPRLWVGQDFSAAPKAIRGISVSPATTSGYAFTAFAVEYSADNVTWFPAFYSPTGLTWATAGEVKTYTW